MPKHKISPYRISLRQDHKTGMKVRPEDLWDLTDLAAINPGLSQYNDFVELIKDFLDDLEEDGYINENAKRTLAVIDRESGSGNYDSDPEARTVEAKISYGRYDRVADHNDKDAFDDEMSSPDSSREEIQRDRDTVAETRLYLLAHMPTTTEKEAFFVLHSYGNYSAKVRLNDALNTFIQDKYDSQNTPFALGVDRRKSSFKLEMNTVAGPELIEELRSSEVAGFEVRKRDTNVPEYMGESSVLGDDAEGNIHVQYTSDDIWSDIGMTLDNLSDKVANEEYPLGELVDDDPSTANALVESSGNHYHRINITKDELRMEKLIPSTEIEYDDQDGRVKLDVIGEISRDFLNGKLQDIGALTLDQQSLLS